MIAEGLAEIRDDAPLWGVSKQIETPDAEKARVFRLRTPVSVTRRKQRIDRHFLDFTASIRQIHHPLSRGRQDLARPDVDHDVFGGVACRFKEKEVARKSRPDVPRNEPGFV